jgi:hypothetical protein
VDEDPIKDQTVLAPELYPGIWEINVASSIMAMDRSDYRLSVSFDGYTFTPATVTGFEREKNGEDATAGITVTRSFAGVFKGNASVVIEGFEGIEEVEVAQADEYTREFTLDRTTPRADFHLVMSEKVGNLFTDCAVNILDGTGRAVRTNAFDGLEADVGVSLPSGDQEATFTLQIVGAFALAADMEEWGFDLEEKYYFAYPIQGQVKRAGGGPLRLYCGVPTDVELSFTENWPAPPSDLKTFGNISFNDTRTDDRRPGDEGGRLVLEIPIRLD